MADREADILDLMVRARDLGNPADWLVRAKHNRALPGGQKLWASVLDTTPLREVRFTLPPGRGRAAREVRQQLYSKRVTLSDRRKGHIEVTCVIAREVDAPAGVKPVEWRLLTNRGAETLEAVVELIDWYRARWEIEIYQSWCLHTAFSQCCLRTPRPRRRVASVPSDAGRGVAHEGAPTRRRRPRSAIDVGPRARLGGLSASLYAAS